jgi:hypothetical protein
MKEIKVVANDKNFTSVNIGQMSEIKDYELPMGDFFIPGKVFAGHSLQTTGAEISFQSLTPVRTMERYMLIRLMRNYIFS